MFNHRQGSVYDSDSNYIVIPSPCACVNEDPSIANLFAKYPGVQMPVMTACRNRMIIPGVVADFAVGHKHFLLMPIRLTPADFINIDHLRRGLIALREFIVVENIKSVAIPCFAKGCLASDFVEAQISEILTPVATGCSIDLYGFKS